MKNKKALFIPLVLAAALFFTTCGLDTIPIVPSPTSVTHEPVYTSSDFAANYFSFTAPTVDSVPDLTFLGTAVYYRIYASSATMLSKQSSISSVNTEADSSAAANRMISYGYQQLNTSEGEIQPLIGKAGGLVTIRLTNYGNGDDANNEYRAQISPITKIPRRSVGTNKTFDFGRHDNNKYTPSENYALPASGDEDFENGTVENNKYYVDMYAVCVGRDATYTRHFSQVLHLGSVPIDATLENN